MYSFGAVPSGVDERDYRLSTLIPIAGVGEIPASFSSRDKLSKVKDQGPVSGCVGESLSYLRDIVETTQNRTPLEFSPGFIYSYVAEGQWPGPGAAPRDKLENLRVVGAVLQKDFPELTEFPQGTYNVDDHKDALRALAAPYKISAYSRVYTVDEIKMAIMNPNIGAVTVMCPVFGSFYTVTRDNPRIPAPIIGEKPHGNHQMTLIGWDEDGWYDGVNSWGESWGNGGFFKIAQDFPFVEAWCVTDSVFPEKPKYWRVQLGAFRIYANAVNYKNVIASMGFPTYIVNVDGMYKVQTGAFSVESNAYARKSELEAFGLKPFIVYY